MYSSMEYENYKTFVSDFYPNSSFLKADGGLTKKLFISFHDMISIIDIFSNIESLNTKCKQLLADQKLICIKSLYILPVNDDFQFYSIMRANVENLLRILFNAFNVDSSYNAIKGTSFSNLSKSLDETYLNYKYKQELNELYSYFGTFSRNIHRISHEENTVVYLKEIMTKPITSKSVEIKINSLEKIRDTLMIIILDVYKLTKDSFDTAQLTRLHTLLGEEAYSELPIFS